MRLIKPFLVFLILLILSAAVSAQESSTITIDSAQKTEYRQNKELGEEEIVFIGGVSISVTKGGSKTTIMADSVRYNRKTEMLYAQGNVSLKQSGGSAGGQDVTADSLLFNAATLEGVFDNGRAVQTQSDAINLPSGSTLVVSSEIFGRDSSNTIAFKNGMLTFCDDENPHWKVWASRIWLLPGGEFAFTNAVLFVGNFPLLYFPAFYYPKDELIFNPVVGYSKRGGYYIQTTTYLMGRKTLESTAKSSTSSSGSDDVTKGLFNFMKSTKLKEQVREGLVLHNLDADYTGNSVNYFKVMADYYTNIGAMIGVDTVYKPKKYITNFEGNLRLGFSNTVFNTNEGFVPFAPSGKRYIDSSNFMGLRMPFRYGANIKLSANKPFSISLTMPVYSDPYFTYDFGERYESMDWIGFLMSGAGKDNTDDSSASEVSSFTWNLNGSYSFKIPDFLNPYVSSASISSASSSIVFSSRTKTFTAEEISADKDGLRYYSPERKFFYPSQITPFKMTTRFSGTLVNIPSNKKSGVLSVPSFPVAMTVPKELEEPKNKEYVDLTNQLDEPVLPESALPAMSTASTSITKFSGINYNLNYSVSPELTSQLNYDATKITAAEDFKWDQIQSSYIQIKAPVNLNSAFSYNSSFFNMNNSFSLNTLFQKHPNLDGYDEENRKSMIKTDYNARKFDLSNTNSISVKPFMYSSIFKDTSLNWNTTVKMMELEFDSENFDGQNPEYKFKDFDFTDDECITTHTLSSTVSAKEGDYSQVLTLSTTLPPQVDKYNASLKLVFPWFNTNFSGGIQKKKDSSVTDQEIYNWEKLPFTESFSMNLFKQITFSQNFSYNLQENHADSLRFSLSWKSISLSYNMAYTYGYNFNAENGWTIKSQKEFLPSTATFNWSPGSTTFRYWRNRISWCPTVRTGITYDALRPTNSYFSFSPTVTFKIHEFLDLSFSAESRNSVIYRYFQGDNSECQIPGETNLFVDLFNSFKFWGNGYFWDPDQTARKSSGFKLKSLNAKITHQLCDWDLSASLEIKPRLITEDSGKKNYDFTPYFKLAVLWKPLSSMKTEIVDDYGTWKLNP